MSNRNATAAILAVLLLLSLAFSVFADGNVIIDVTVPTEHTVTLVCGKGGKVSVAQNDYTGTNHFTVIRHGEFSFSAVPLSDYELDSVISSRANETEILNDGAKIEKLCGDAVITVIFRPKEQSQASSGITVPITAKDNSLLAKAVIEGNKAIIDVDENGLENLLTEGNEASSVEINASEVNEDINRAVIPISTVRKIAEQTKASENALSAMELQLPQSTVTFDSASLSSIAEQAQGDTVTLHIEQIDVESLNTTQQTALTEVTENTIIIEVSLMSGNTYISDFKGGSSEITLPYTPQKGEDTETISVWFVSVSGVMENIPCKYDNGFVRFTVYHYSNYLIKAGRIDTPPDSGSHCFICGIIGRNVYPWCIIIPISALVALVGVIITILFNKRKVEKHKYEKNDT